MSLRCCKRVLLATPALDAGAPRSAFAPRTWARTTSNLRARNGGRRQLTQADLATALKRVLPCHEVALRSDFALLETSDESPGGHFIGANMGRPRTALKITAEIVRLRNTGLSQSRIAAIVRVSGATVCRTLQGHGFHGRVVEPETNLANERWKDVVGYEGLYRVSSLGRLRSKFRLLSSGSNRRTGYMQIGLTKDSVTRFHTVHSLVAAAFIGPRPQGYEVAHKNDVRSDNNWTNLSYSIPSRNRPAPLRGENQGNSKLKTRDVLKIRALEGTEKASRVAEMYGVTGTLVYMIWRRHIWTHV
jgi:hypothetical protein